MESAIHAIATAVYVSKTGSRTAVISGYIARHTHTWWVGSWQVWRCQASIKHLANCSTPFPPPFHLQSPNQDALLIANWSRFQFIWPITFLHPGLGLLRHRMSLWCKFKHNHISWFRRCEFFLIRRIYWHQSTTEKAMIALAWDDPAPDHAELAVSMVWWDHWVHEGGEASREDDLPRWSWLKVWRILLRCWRTVTVVLRKYSTREAENCFGLESGEWSWAC